MRPEPFDLFLRYHLGLDGDLQSRFYNLGALSREFGVTAEEMSAWLQEAGLSADISGHVDFRLAEAHGRALDLALDGDTVALKVYVRQAWEGYTAALATYDPRVFRDGVNWDDIWGDDEG